MVDYVNFAHQQYNSLNEDDLQQKPNLNSIEYDEEPQRPLQPKESENKELKNVLPKVYGKANLDKASLGQLIDLISNTELQAENEKSKDLFGSKGLR